MEKQTDPLSCYIELAWRRLLQKSAMDTGMRDVFAAGYQAAYERHYNFCGLVGAPEKEYQDQPLKYLEGGHGWWDLVDREVAGSCQRERGIIARAVTRDIPQGERAVDCREIIDDPWQLTDRNVPPTGAVKRIQNHV